MTISQRIFYLLDTKNKKQNELSSFVGVSTSTVSAWNKRGTDPPANLIPKIAEFFEISIIYLLTGEDNEEQTRANSGQTINIKDIKDSNVNNFNRSEVTYNSDNSYSEITSHLDSLSLRERRRAELDIIELLEDNYPVKKK